MVVHGRVKVELESSMNLLAFASASLVPPCNISGLESVGDEAGDLFGGRICAARPGRYKLNLSSVLARSKVSSKSDTTFKGQMIVVDV